ncbi:MAG TPA: hypothetical protein VGE34_03560 [Candidatus Saccharimonadales bacterium]
MEKGSGIKIEDSQLLICKGTYGGKGWTPAERSAACQRYKEITGKDAALSSSPLDNSQVLSIVISSVLVLILLAYLTYVFYKKKTSRKSAKGRKRKKS